MLAHGRSNAKVVEIYEESLVSAVADRIMLLTHHDLEDHEDQPMDLLEMGMCDVIRVFVKGEPHSLKKIEEKRFRLIFSESLIDQCVERFFAQKQNKREVSIWSSLPSLIGIGFDKRHVEAMTSNPSWFAPHATLCCTDVKQWDWSVQYKELMFEAHIRASLISNCSDNLELLIKNRFYCLTQKICVFSDGTTAIPPKGVMPSGSYVTSSSNSRIRLTLGLRCRARYNQPLTTNIKCVGDDCIEEHDLEDESSAEALEFFGHPVKLMEKCTTEDFEFCSHQFENNIPRPLSMGKSMYKYMQGRRNADQTAAMIGMTDNLRPHDREAVLEIINRFGMPDEESNQEEGASKEDASEEDDCEEEAPAPF